MNKLQALFLFGFLVFLQSQIIAQCPSLLQNPDFENGLTDWNVSATNNVTISTDAFSGSSAARICDGPGGFNQVFSTQPGETYDVSFLVKTESGHGFSVFQIRSLDANWTPIEITGAPPGTRYAIGSGILGDDIYADYRSLEFTFTTPPNAAWFQVSVWNEGSGCLLIDDWTVCEVSSDLFPDLLLENMVFDENVVSPGENLDFDYDYVNDSSQPYFGNYSIKSYISTDQTISSDDTPFVIFANTTFGATAPNSRENRRSSVPIPNSLASRDYYLITKVDSEDQALETNEDNNLLILPFTVSSAISRLEIVGDVCPNQYPNDGNSTLVPFRVKNTGGSPSDPSKIYLYRQVSCRFCVPLNLGGVDVPALAPGEEMDLVLTATFQGLIPGRYNVQGQSVQDVWGDFFLSDEVAQFPRSLKDIDFYCRKTVTDLSVEIVVANPVFDASGEISFVLKVTNNGVIGARNVAVYFLDQISINNNSLAQVVDANGTALESTPDGVQWVIPGLAPNSVEEITVTYQILGPGQQQTLPDFYDVTATISSGHNTDSDPFNDSAYYNFVKSTTPPPNGGDGNLTLTASSSSPTIDAWQFGEVTFVLKNEGSIPVSNIGVDFRLDDNLRLKGGDEFTASAGTVDGFWSQFPTWVIDNLGGGESAIIAFNTFALTGDEMPFYGQVVNSNPPDPTSTPANGIYPTPNEDDEAVWVYNGGTPPTGTPDLQMGSFIMGSSLAQGENFLSNFNFRNIGDGDITSPFSLKVYLSTDRTPSNDDFVVGNYDFTALPLNAGDSHANRIVVAIPNDAPVGNYFLIYSLDADNVIAEPNEVNNLNSRNFEVTSGANAQPDLTISNLFLDETTVKTGEVLNYSFDLANIGNQNVPGNFIIRAYLSTDGDISSDDIQDGIVPTGNFDAGLSVNAVPGASTINLPEGDYYLLLRVDADDQVAESDETNNLAQSSIQFTVDNGNTSAFCDKPVGSGSVDCFEVIPGTDNYRIGYDSSGWQVSKVLDTNLDVISTSAPTQIPTDVHYRVDSTTLIKRDRRGMIIFEKTIPQNLADKMKGSLTAVEFQGGYVFLAWRNLDTRPVYSADSLFAIRTDAAFNILYENQVWNGNGDPSGNTAYRATVVNSNGIAFYVRTGFSSSGSLRLFLMDGTLNVLDNRLIFGGAFSIGGDIRENSCGNFTVTDFIGFSYCKSGGCYGGHEKEYDYTNNQIEVLNLFGFEHRTTVGIGSESWVWHTNTTDGGRVSGTRRQGLPIAPSSFGNPVPLDETINFTKTDAAGNQIAAWSVLVPGAENVERIYEDNGRIFLVKKGNPLTISELDCYDDPPPPGGVDLELVFGPNTTGVPPAQWSFFGQNLTIQNNGTESATGIRVEFKKDDGVVYKGNDEFTASQGSFEYYGNEIWDVGTLAPGESAVLTVNYFRISGNDLNLYAQVSAMDQTDADSSPGNGSCCISNEDDEAVLVIGSSANAVGNRTLLEENISEHEGFAILNAAPNPFSDRLTLNVFSKENTNSDLIVYDVWGKPVLRQAIELIEGHNSISVDANDLPSGILTVTMSPNHLYLRQVRVLKIRD